MEILSAAEKMSAVENVCGGNGCGGEVSAVENVSAAENLGGAAL